MSHHYQLSDTEIEKLWEQLGDIPVVEDGTTLKESSLEGLSQEEGGTLLNEDPYIDEDFSIWPRGTSLLDIWMWFDCQYSIGLAGLKGN